jgi:spore germination cell wall hydrolase CwlJ-like protein
MDIFRRVDAMQMIMQRVITICVAIMFFVSTPLIAAEQTQKAKTAERKAEVLEQHAADGKTSRPAASVIISKPETQAVDPAGTEPLDEAITCLSRTIYWETKGEDAASMEAVANVVMNRLGQQNFPDTICAVVREGSEQGACQFSWWCDGRSDAAEDEKSYAIAKEIARKALNKQLPDRTAGALYFHNSSVTTDWSKKYIKTLRVGKLVFYKPRGGAAK